MPNLRKTVRAPRRPKSDGTQHVRLSGTWDGAVRALAAKAAAKEAAKKKKPRVLPAPRTPFDGERQTLLCLYLHLFISEHPEGVVATEFFRAYRHLLEGGSLDTLPLQLVNKEQFLTEVAELKAGKRLLLDDPSSTIDATGTGETDTHEQRQPDHRHRPR